MPPLSIPAAQRTRREWWWWLAAWLVCAALLALGLWHEYQQTEERERERLVHQVRTIDANLARQLVAIDHVLQTIVGDLPRWQLREDLPQWLDGRLLSFVQAMPSVRSIHREDAHGRVIASSEAALLGTDVSDRPQFKAARSAAAGTLVVGAPVESVLGGWIVVLARGVFDAQGQWDGMVSAALEPEQFQTLLQSVRYAPDMVTAVAHGDGVRFALASGDGPAAAGVSLAQPGTLWSRHRASGQRETVLQGTILDPGGKTYLMAQRTVQPEALAMDKPFYVAAARELRAVFAPWRRQLWLAALAWLGLGLASAAALAALQRRRRGLLQTEQMLRVRWEGALQATNQGVWDYDCRSGHVYYSPIWAQMMGSTAQAIGDRLDEWLQRVHPDDLPRVRQQWERHLQGSTDQYECMHRLRRNDGSWLWVLDRGRITERDAQGRPLRMVGVKVDVSERQQLQEKLDRLADNVPGLLFQYQLDPDGSSRYPYVSRGVRDIYECTPGQLRHDAGMVFARLHPDDLAQGWPAVEASARDLTVWRAEFRVLLPLRGERWLRGDAVPERLANGGTLWSGYVQDITESKHRDIALQQTQAMLQHVMQLMPLALCMADHSGLLYFRNRRFAEIFGYGEGELLTLERWWLEVYPDPDYRAQVMAEWSEIQQRARAGSGVMDEQLYRVWTRHGTQRTMRIGGIVFGDHFLATFVDQTEQQAQAQLLHRLAYIDGLTGIANRRQFDEQLQAEWSRCQRNGTALAVVMMDIDHFKAYNDLYGHPQGDECLKAMAEVLQQGLSRPYDLVARYGGEEFVCLLPECDLAGANAKAQALLEAVRARALAHAGSPVAPVVTLSAGVASQVPDVDTHPAALLALADERLYRAKRGGRNRIDDGGAPATMAP